MTRIGGTGAGSSFGVGRLQDALHDHGSDQISRMRLQIFSPIRQS
jgi:hypothetical protein